MTYRIIWRKKRQYNNPYNVVAFTYEEMKPQITKEYNHRFITPAVAPHDYTNTHFILWPKNQARLLTDISADAQQELMSIMQERYDANYTIYRNCPDDVTVTIKLHFHVVQFKNIVNLIVEDTYNMYDSNSSDSKNNDSKPKKSDISV